MKILLLTLGSRGDVQPFIAIGKGLKNAGHEVTVCTSASFKAFIIEHGLNYSHMTDEFIQLADTDMGKQAIGNAGGQLMWDSIKQGINLLKRIKPVFRQVLADAWQAAQEAEAIIYHPKAIAGYHMAEKLGIPGFMTLLFPLYVPTAMQPASGFPNLKIGGWYNKLTYRLVPLLAQSSFQGIVNQWRRNTLGLLKRSLFANDLIRENGQAVPVLHGYSSYLLPRPDDWPSSVVVNGFWFLERTRQWQPPANLLDFLAAGPPPVYVGFGSMSGRNAEQTTRIVVEALNRAGQRGIIAAGWGGLTGQTLPDTIYKINAAPHDWLFPKTAAVVHHGGAGSTAAGLLAGRPTLICPFFADQPFWGKRVWELGLGPEPIPQKKLSVDKLTTAVAQMVHDKQMQQRAMEFSQKLQEEDGVAQAVRFIHQQIQSFA